MPFKNIHPLYGAFQAMKDRCRNKNHRSWHRYGGRGIKVCDRWLEKKQGFINFLEDMGEKPEGFTLDRIDNDGNYCKENCRWASHKIQKRNQSVTRKVLIDGNEYIAADISEISGLKTDTIVNRAKSGLKYEEVISKSKRVYEPGLKLGGKANGERQKSKTHCPYGHPYDGDNLSLSSQGWRRCKICKNLRQIEYMKRKNLMK